MISIIFALSLPLAAVAASVPHADALEAYAVDIASNAARRDTDYAAFHGCVDWHSAVHAHWALYRLARHKIRPGLARSADVRLSPRAVEEERRLLQENPAFEMPYGRAWFLRLAVERAAWARETGAPDVDLLTPAADEAAASLLAHFEEFPPTPFAGEYANPSWALAQLHAYAVERGEPRRLARVNALVEKMLSAGSAGFDADFALPQFFSIYGNWAYLVAVAKPEALAEFLARRPMEDAALAPVTRLLAYAHKPSKTYEVDSHQLGLNWSRAWALKALARAGGDERERLERAYKRHVEQGLKERDLYARDYRRYGHWVPQFAVYALTDGDL